MKRPGLGVLARSALAALAALLVVGWIQSADLSAPLVAAGAEDLEKFAVIDMADAVARVSGAEVAAKAD